MTDITWPSPFGYTDFCDDIRHEINGKVTLVGIYAAELSVYGQVPAVIPKLMLAIHYFERHEEASTPLQLRVFLPDDPEDAPSQSVDIPPREYAALPPTDEDLRAAMNFALQISPLIVTKSGLIKVRMVRGDDTIRLGSLRVKLLTEAEAIAAGLIQAPAI